MKLFFNLLILTIDSWKKRFRLEQMLLLFRGGNSLINLRLLHSKDSSKILFRPVFNNIVVGWAFFAVYSVELVEKEAQSPSPFFHVGLLFRIHLGPGCRKDRDIICAMHARIVFSIRLISIVVGHCGLHKSIFIGSSAFIQNEVHDKFCQYIRSERRLTSFMSPYFVRVSVRNSIHKTCLR